MGKKIFLALFAIILVIILLLLQQLGVQQGRVTTVPLPTERQYELTEATPTLRLAQKEVAVIVDFGNGRKIEGGVEAVNAYEALANLAIKRDIIVSVKQYKFGVLVETIDDLTNSNVAAWGYSVNGKIGQIAADHHLVNPSDTVLWEYKRIN